MSNKPHWVETSVDDLLGDDEDLGFVNISIKSSSDQPPVQNYKFYEQSINVSDMNQVVGKIKKSSFDYNDIQSEISDPRYDRSARESFSDINGGGSQNINDSFCDLNSSKMSKLNNSKKKSQEDSQGQFYLNQRSKIYGGQKFVQPQNIFQSVYMPKVPSSSSEKEVQQQKEQTKKPESLIVAKQSRLSKKQEIQKGQVKLIFRSTTYYFQTKDYSLQIDVQSLKDIYDQFFTKVIFVPLFKYQRYQQLLSSKNSRYDQDAEPHKIFKANIERYTRYLNENYAKQFQEVLRTVQASKQGSNKRKREKEVTGIFSYLYETFSSMLSYSKAYILRTAILTKIRSLQEVEKYCKENAHLANQAEKIKQTIQKQWQEFGQVELMFNFQQTQAYCDKKIDSNPQPNFKQIWTKYRDHIRKEKQRHLRQNLTALTL